MVTHQNRQDTAACASLSFIYNVKQQGAFRLRNATDNPLPGIPFYGEAGLLGADRVLNSHEPLGA